MSRKKGKTREGQSAEQKLLDRCREIAGLTDRFCDAYLDEEYRELCREMVGALSETDLALGRSRAASWASGIVHALGWVNFLQNPRLSPYISSAQIAEGFGVSQATMAAKSRMIKDALDLIALDPDWCVSAMLELNPLVWMLEVDGFIIDVRLAPRELQEAAYGLGLIPYIPADREGPGAAGEADTNIIVFPSTQPAGRHKKPGQARKGADEPEFDRAEQ